MKKIHIILFLFLFILTVFKSFSQQVTIILTNYEFSNNQLIITYQIDSKSLSDKFKIKIEIKKENGEAIVPESITGDLGDNIKPGKSKTIVWDLAKDAIYLNENISVKITGEKQIATASKGSIIILSAAVPGLGQTKMNGKPWWLGGIVAYGAIAGGYIFHKSSLDTYKKYKDEITDPLERADLWNQVEKKHSISNILFISAASIWISNLVWVSVSPYKNQPSMHSGIYLRPSISPYYKGALVSLKMNF